HKHNHVTKTATSKINHIYIKKLIKIKSPCAKAICIAEIKFKYSDIVITRDINGFNNNMTIIVPIKLKITWDAAVRFATMLVPNAANTAVIVVPILLPNNSGKAAPNVIEPCENISCKIPIKALEL